MPRRPRSATRRHRQGSTDRTRRSQPATDGRGSPSSHLVGARRVLDLMSRELRERWSAEKPLCACARAPRNFGRRRRRRGWSSTLPSSLACCLKSSMPRCALGLGATPKGLAHVLTCSAGADREGACAAPSVALPFADQQPEQQDQTEPTPAACVRAVREKPSLPSGADAKMQAATDWTVVASGYSCCASARRTERRRSAPGASSTRRGLRIPAPYMTESCSVCTCRGRRSSPDGRWAGRALARAHAACSAT